MDDHSSLELSEGVMSEDASKGSSPRRRPAVRRVPSTASDATRVGRSRTRDSQDSEALSRARVWTRPPICGPHLQAQAQVELFDEASHVRLGEALSPMSEKRRSRSSHRRPRRALNLSMPLETRAPIRRRGSARSQTQPRRHISAEVGAPLAEKRPRVEQ